MRDDQGGEPHGQASLVLGLGAEKAVLVPEGHKRFLVSHAVGVQIYSCNGSAWTFVAARADLYDKQGRELIGTRFAGPR